MKVAGLHCDTRRLVFSGDSEDRSRGVRVLRSELTGVSVQSPKLPPVVGVPNSTQVWGR